MVTCVNMEESVCIKQPDGVHIPSERTIYRVMKEIGLNHKPKCKPNGITKADKEARKSDDLIKRDFSAENPLEKCITDMPEIKASDGKLYVSSIFDRYDLAVLGLAMDTNMKAPLCKQTLDNAYKAYPMLRGATLHCDRDTQYTSELYRNAMSAANVMVSANMIMGGFASLIPLDQTTETLFHVGRQLPSELRCTCHGGLCTTPCG